jgi:hypothetical protein
MEFTVTVSHSFEIVFEQVALETDVRQKMELAVGQTDHAYVPPGALAMGMFIAVCATPFSV